jgi:hypothetical protein
MFAYSMAGCAVSDKIRYINFNPSLNIERMGICVRICKQYTIYFIYISVLLCENDDELCYGHDLFFVCSFRVLRNMCLNLIVLFLFSHFMVILRFVWVPYNTIWYGISRHG